MQNLEEIEELAYLSLMGLLEDTYNLNWIEPIFVEGHLCHTTYTEALEARDRICERLEEYDDWDCQAMFDALIKHAHILSCEMFRQGMNYQKMLDKSIVQKGNP